MGVSEMEQIISVLRFSGEYFSTPNSGQYSSSDLCFRATKAKTKSSVDVMTAWAGVCEDLLNSAFETARSAPVGLPGFPLGMSPESAAEEVRNFCGLSSDEPITHLTRRMEAAGIYIFSAPFEMGSTTHHDAVSLWVSPRRQYPIVLLRRIKSWEQHGHPWLTKQDI
ncbi:hypothetical protein [Arthrobacter sp. D3-16]